MTLFLLQKIKGDVVVMEVTPVEVKQYFNGFKKEVLERQTHWEEIDPRPHAVGVFVRLRRLTWYEEILPKIEEAIALIEDIEEKQLFIK